MANTPKPDNVTTRPNAGATKMHPAYTYFREEWVKLSHVREGTGGFRDGTYIIPHPREWQDHESADPQTPTKKLLERRALAYYEDIADAIMEAKKTALFREQPVRDVGGLGDKAEGEKPSDLEQWWQNVDGCGTQIDDFMQHAWDPAGTYGHVLLYMDRPKGTPGATQADVKQPYVRLYSPLDMPVWMCDEMGQLKAVIFQESAADDSFDQAAAVPRVWTREINDQTWVLRDENGTTQAEGEHKMGVLPVVPLYSRRRSIIAVVGKSVLGDPRVYINLFNLVSEIRELLRKQTFSWINVPTGVGPDAPSYEKVVEMLGKVIGSSNVLITPEEAQILSADASNIESYHKEYDRCLRTLYRAAGVQWESDSKDAEAVGSLKLKREEMNTRLAGYADELEKTDYALARLFYRAKFGPDQGPKRFEDAKVTIKYPDTFDTTPFDVVLEQAQGALSLGMPPEFMKALRKALAPKFLPDLSPKDLEMIQSAIENAKDDLTPDARLEQRLKIAASRTGQPSAVPRAEGVEA